MTDFNPSQLARRDTDRMARYRQNLDFYSGKQWPAQSRHRQLVFNYARVAVNKITSYLMQGLTVACYPEVSGKGGKDSVRRAEQLLKEVYLQNNLQQLDWETEIDTAVLGDGCYKVTWDAQEKRVRITSPDVSGIYAWWLGDDMSRVWRMASRYELEQDEIKMLYGRATGKKSSTITEVWTDAEFRLYLDNELISASANPYGFIPFIIFPNLREPKQFWGTSDVPAIVQPQRELNRSLSQLSRILELSGNPITILKGVSDEEGNIQVNPGQYWEIPEDADISVLDMLKGGGVRLHIDYIDIIYRALHDISETPRASYGGIEKELSGAALKVEMGSLIQKVTRKRTIRTGVYNRRNAMILSLARQYSGEIFEGITHRVIWGSILPSDEERQAQNEQLLVQAGIHSRRTAMDELGLQDPDAEFGKWLEEREQILRMNSDMRTQSTRGGARERATAAEMEIPE
jgi:hypothetical protein